MKILFTAGGSPGNEMIFQKLNKTHDFFFADADLNRISDVIPISKRLLVPLVDQKQYYKIIEDFCSKNKIKILVPGIDEELLNIIEYFKLNEEISLFLPSKKFISNMLDKYLSMKVLANFGFPVPKTLKINNAHELNNFPLILKPRHGRGSRGIQVVTKKTELELYIKLKAISEEDYICQTFEEGQEYTVQVLNIIDQNKALIIPLKVLLKKGVTLTAEVDFDRDIIDLCTEIAVKFKESNIFNIQLIKSNKYNTIKIFEINPRFSTTTCILPCLGIDPFKIEETNLNQSKLNMYQGLKLNRTLTNSVR